MKTALTLTALTACTLLTGCVTIPGSCVQTGSYQTRCYSTQYATNCWSGPTQSCKHRWVWEPDPEEERMAAAYRQIFGKTINGQ